LLVAALYAAIALLFVRIRILHPDASPHALAFGDLRTLYHPLLDYGFGALRAGRLPLWNPHQSCGMPFLADPSIGFFYPLYLPFLFLPADVALDVDLVLHLALAALAMWLLCRHFGLGRGPALVAGLVYAYQGSVITKLAYPSFLVSIAWLPLIALLADRLLLVPSRRACAALALAVGVSLLGGYFQLVYFTSLALAPLLGARLVALARHPGVAPLAPRVALLAVALALGLGTSLVRILPGLEFMQQTWRPLSGLSSAMASIMAIEPRNFLRGLLSPAAALPPGADWVSYQLRESCVGPLPLALAVVGLVMWRSRGLAIATATIAVTAAWYGFGPHGSLYGILFALPGGDLFRGPDRALVLYGFAVAILGGAGLHELLTRLAMRTGDIAPLPRVAPLALAAAVVGAIAAAAAYAAPTGAALSLGEGGVVLAVIAAAAWTLRPRLLLGAGSAAAAAVIFADLVCGDLHTGAMPSQLRATAARHDALFEAIRARQGHDRTYFWASFEPGPPLFFFSDVAKAGIMHGLWLCTDYAGGVSWQRHERFMDALGPPLPLGYRPFEVTEANLPLLQLAGIRFYLVPDRQPVKIEAAVRDRWRLLQQRDELSLFEDPGAQPRAFLVDRVEIAADGETARRRLSAVDLRRVAVIEPEGEPPSPPSAGDAAGSATIVAYAPEAVTVETSSNRPALLVLTDQYDANWRAHIDGTPAPIHRTDYLFRGVAVPAGTHRVEFTYTPAAVRWGAAGSLASVAVIGVLTLRRGPRRMRRTTATGTGAGW
jgi:hypothetical protein